MTADVGKYRMDTGPHPLFPRTMPVSVTPSVCIVADITGLAEVRISVLERHSNSRLQRLYTHAREQRRLRSQHAM